MDYRTPLQHLLRTLLPSRSRPEAPVAQPEFADTCPDADRPPSRGEPARNETARAAPAPRRQATAWAQSSIELIQGTEVMEYSDDTVADLMDEYFAEPKKRAA
jgi:hypothetical protein